MTLQEFCDSLSKKKQLELALSLNEKALPIWDKYVEQNTLVYRDSVVGLNHEVPNKLLADTIKEIKKYISGITLLRFLKSKTNLMKLHSHFGDPIVALQDLDWELPVPVEKIFYSIYNLLESVMGKHVTVFEEKTIYVSINQAIEALESGKVLTEFQIKEILKGYRNSSLILQS